MLLYRLSAEANKRFEPSDLSVREIARRLKTSPTQIYRLLDTTNYAKSLQNVMALLNVLGCSVEIEFKDRKVVGGNDFICSNWRPSFRTNQGRIKAMATKEPAPMSAVHSDPEILGGTPVFRGTRVPVQALFDYIEAGDPLERFLDHFPSVTRDQAIAALEQAAGLLGRAASS